MFKPISVAVGLVSRLVGQIEAAVDDADSVWDAFCDGDDEVFGASASLV